jgi:hypothetical protein
MMTGMADDLARGLTPGVLDAQAQRAFRLGGCAGLALALHRRTGWPLVKVTDAEAVYAGDGWDPLAHASLRRRADALHNQCGMGCGGLHWGVLHPTGQLVDVDGLNGLLETVRRYDPHADGRRAALGLSSVEELLDEYVEARGEPVPLTLAASFVEPVLALVAGQLARQGVAGPGVR